MRHIPALKHARSILTLWFAGALALILTSCGGGYSSGGGGGMGTTPCGGAYSACPPPTVALTAPAPGATVSGTVALTATAAASTMNGLTVTRVDFMIDGTMVGTASTSPYTVNWNSTTVAAASHSLTAKVTDSMNDTATTPAIMITTTGHAAMTVTMTSAQIFPAPRSSASGMANLTVQLETGATRGKVQLSGVTATAVTINEGFAGSSGAAVIRLTPAAGAADEWEVPAGALLTAEQVSALMQGKLYVIATSVANPRGEIRGQMLPDNIVVAFSSMERTQAVVAVGLAAGGVAAATVDTTANTLSMHVNSTGVDDAMAAQVATGAAGATGAELAGLTKDAVNMGHWSTELASVSAADVGNFKAGRWYVSVATPAEPSGALRAQIK